MRTRLALALIGAALLTACAGDSSGPSTPDGLSLIPEFAESMASSVDAGGIGGVMLPDNLALSTEQKAAIAALHEAFKAATAGDIVALRALEAEARTAHAAGNREAVQAILARSAPILARLGLAFAGLQAAIWQVYTPEQRAWLASHRPPPCGPGGPPKLSEAQLQQIRTLQQAFVTAVAADIALIRQTAEAAHHAAQAGASHAEIEQILHQADGARARVHAAELRLQHDIDALLTPEQRAHRCGAANG